VTNLGSKAVFRTNRHAKNFKLIQIDLEQPAESSWVDLVPEHRQDQEFGAVLRIHNIWDPDLDPRIHSSD
jgi:protease II